MYITDMSAFYVLTGQVTYRMTYNQSSHIRVRSDVYHFVRRVPAVLQQHYRSDRDGEGYSDLQTAQWMKQFQLNQNQGRTS